MVLRWSQRMELNIVLTSPYGPAEGSKVKKEKKNQLTEKIVNITMRIWRYMEKSDVIIK
jgi:hypothetical protein